MRIFAQARAWPEVIRNGSLKGVQTVHCSVKTSCRLPYKQYARMPLWAKVAHHRRP